MSEKGYIAIWIHKRLALERFPIAKEKSRFTERYHKYLELNLMQQASQTFIFLSRNPGSLSTIL